MPAKKKAEPKQPSAAVVRLDLAPAGLAPSHLERLKELVANVKEKIHLVPVHDLVPFTVRADKFNKMLGEIKDIVKAELVNRRNQVGVGEICGDDNQNRRFVSGAAEILLVQKDGSKFNPAKAETILREKKLWESAITLYVIEGLPQFQEFLKKHRQKLESLGVVFSESLSKDKVDALVALQYLTLDDVEGMMDRVDEEGKRLYSYAMTPKLKG